MNITDVLWLSFYSLLLQIFVYIRIRNTITPTLPPRPYFDSRTRRTLKKMRIVTYRMNDPTV